MGNCFEIVVPAATKNINLLIKLILPRLRLYFPENPIIVLTSINNFPEDIEVSGVVFMDEDTVIDGLTLEKVRALLEFRIESGDLAGWYFQQFLKLGWAFRSTFKHYLVWDADTIPLRKIDFFDEYGKVYFTPKDEYHVPYFTTLEKIFDGAVKKKTPYSFIAEHMMIDCQLMKEMIARITPEPLFWERIIECISTSDLAGSGFSEFETFGNYVLNIHPESYCFRLLKTFRYGSEVLSNLPGDAQIEWFAGAFDSLSIEAHNPFINKSLGIVRCLFFICRKLRLPADKVASAYLKVRTSVRFFLFRLSGNRSA